MNLIEQVLHHGVVGAGGAGFPTHAKINAKVEYFIVNAVECEPLLYTDQHVINHFSKQVIQAIEAVSNHLEAKHKVIAIKSIKVDQINTLKQAIKQLDSQIEIFEMGNYYPAGDEQMIVFDVTGRSVTPGGIPLSVDTVVSNVATMLNVYDAMQGVSVTHKYLTVSGEVREPKVLKVPVGTFVKDCLNAVSGVQIAGYKIVNGGPMMGQIHDPSHLEELVVTKTTSGILVIDNDNFNARLDGVSMKKTLSRAKSACIQCQFCSSMCPRKLIGHEIHPHKVMGQMSCLDLDQVLTQGLQTNPILEQALLCCECGICETYACPMGLYPRQVNKLVKQSLSKQNIRYTPPDKKNHPSDERKYRKIQSKAIMNRMGLGSIYEIKPQGYAELDPDCVRLPLSQHIGAPAVPIVATGDTVCVGQLIAKTQQNALSINIHASIAGVVTVSDHDIKIVRS